MRITVVSYGSAGDVRPMVALGLGLRTAGHEVVLVGEGGGTRLAGAHGLDYRVLAGDLRTAMAMGGALAGVFETGRLDAGFLTYRTDHLAWLRTIGDAARGSDLVVAMPVTGYHALSAALSHGARRAAAVLQPLSPTREFLPTALRPGRLPALLNRPVGRLLERVGWAALGPGVNRARRKLGQPRIGDPLAGVPTLCAWSPTLLPKPADWDERFTVTGQWLLPDPAFEPDEALRAYLDDGPPPVYVGFGSMPLVPRLRRLLGVLFAGLAGHRVLVSSGWAGLAGEELPAHVHPIGFVPHEWLLPRCAALVHHCGAGTSHAAVRAGVPSIPAPFAMDQPFWAGRLVRLGVASRPLDPGTATADDVRAALREVETPAVRQACARGAAALATEDGVAVAVRALERLAQPAG